MADIIATNPVTEPATGSVTFDKWFMTQLIAKLDPISGKTIVHLKRAAKTTGGWVLMDSDADTSEVVFSLDIFHEALTTPELATAIDAVTTAVVAYATKKHLL